MIDEPTKATRKRALRWAERARYCRDRYQLENKWGGPLEAEYWDMEYKRARREEMRHVKEYIQSKGGSQ